ncbi:MAG: hypothetical protein JJU08_04045 [Rhodobacteraceae bacterium]|nr:hypothetical protein [Paracoccaceae bacterium]
MNFAADLCDRASTLWHIQRVRYLVRTHAQIGPNALITVAQFDCPDPACPGPKTQITILGFDLMRRSLLIHLPVADIMAEDLDAAIK